MQNMLTTATEITKGKVGGKVWMHIRGFSQEMKLPIIKACTKLVLRVLLNNCQTYQYDINVSKGLYSG